MMDQLENPKVPVNEKKVLMENFEMASTRKHDSDIAY
jgi:hypothetical protein